MLGDELKRLLESEEVVKVWESDLNIDVTSWLKMILNVSRLCMIASQIAKDYIRSLVSN